jgi:FkbM family methyltransferase
MSRFTRLRNHLSLADTLSVYTKMKFRKADSLTLSYIRHPFTIRNNPHDYATFEEVLVQKSYQIATAISPKTIIDAGGNIGLTAVFFANQYPDAKIVTLEPDGDNFEVLGKNVQPYKNIEPMKCGLWSKTTFLDVINTGKGPNAFMVKETTCNTSSAVAALSVADIIKQQNWPNADLVKMDIEGSEKEVFEGEYPEWLPKTKIVVVELHDRMRKGCSKAVFTAFSNYNFSCAISGENLIFTNEDKL